MDYKSGVCNFCGTGCGNYLNIKDGKVSGVFSSRNHPVSKGRLCVRGWHFHELLMSDQRISSPMIKVDGTFKKAGYDEAINFMMEKMAKYSANAAEETAFLASPRSSNENNYLFTKLARSVFKTNNITLDSESGHRNSMNVLSEGAGFPGMTGSLEDISKTAFILVVGSDITKMNPIIGSEIHKAQMAGTEVVTISSRVTQIAKLSNTHLQIRPGSKKTLLAALAKAVIAEGKADADFITGSTEGFDGFATSVNNLDFNDVLSLTGIDYDTIAKTAGELCSAKSAMAFWSTGISGLDQDTVSYIYNLLLIAGKMGKENCGANPITGICNLQGGYDMGTAPDLFTGFQKISDPDALAKFEKSWGVKLNKDAGKDLYKMLADKNSKLKCLVVADHDKGIVRYAKEIEALEFVAYFGTFDNPFVHTLIDPDWIKTNYSQAWQDLGTMTGPNGDIVAGIWARANGKSFVFYPKKAFDEAGYTVPTTWEEMMTLTEQIASDGDTPWCIGIESGAATGWTMTDWIEDLMLRVGGAEAYDKWVAGELKFDSPEMNEVLDYIEAIWFNDAYVYGGRAAIPTINFGDAPKPMFENPPKCWFNRQGNFVTTFFPEEAVAGEDYSFFYLPGIKEEYGSPVLGAGDIYAVFNDRPEVRAVIQYFSTGESLKVWVEQGGAILTHNDASLDWYVDPVTRGVAETIRNATTFRFDGSDMMPGAVGAGTFWKYMTDYVSGSITRQEALQQIDASWPTQ